MSILSGRALILEERSKLCTAIASLPNGATNEDVAMKIDPIISKWNQTKAQNYIISEVDSEIIGDGVTPIMVACDKGKLSTLDYIKRHYQATNLAVLWGHPLSSSAKHCGSNTAAHLAAMSGSSKSIDYLSTMLTIVANDNLSDTCTKNNNEKEDIRFTFKNLIKLLSKKNHHGDTPIMMACVQGKCIQYWLASLTDSMCEDDSLSSIQDLFNLQNDSGDTALSLTCGHGHYHILDLLINHQPDLFKSFVKNIEGGNNFGSIVDVTYEDIKKCEQTLKKIDTVLQQVRIADKNNLEYQKRRDDVKRCLVMLQVASARMAQQNMDRLLATADEEERREKEGNRTSRKNPQKKTRKKTKSIGRKDLPPQNNTEQVTSDNKEIDDDYSEDESDEEYQLDVFLNQKQQSKTKRNKNMTKNPEALQSQSQQIRSSDSSNALSDVNDDLTPAALLTTPQERMKSVEEMLRERLSEPNMKSGNNIHVTDQTVDEVMDSLCLDASMLLLNSHGMAMKLSPCQLDAVASILKKQLESVEKAQQIQGRLRSSTSST